MVIYTVLAKNSKKSTKKSKKFKKIKKLKIFGTISGALARSLIVVYIAARIYRGWHESQECAILKLR